MMKTEYTENGGFLQRDSVEHEEYAEACSIENQEIKERDGADLLEKVFGQMSIKQTEKREKIKQT